MPALARCLMTPKGDSVFSNEGFVGRHVTPVPTAHFVLDFATRGIHAPHRGVRAWSARRIALGTLSRREGSHPSGDSNSGRGSSVQQAGPPDKRLQRPASPAGRRVPQKLLHEDSPASLAPRQQDGSRGSRLLARHVPAEGRRVMSLWSVSGCELLARLTRGFLFNAQPAEKPRDQIAHCGSSLFVQDESSNELPLRRASGTAEEGVLGPRRLRRSTGRRRSIAGLKLTFRGRKRVACWHQQLRPSP